MFGSEDLGFPCPFQVFEGQASRRKGVGRSMPRVAVEESTMLGGAELGGCTSGAVGFSISGGAPPWLPGEYGHRPRQ